jgi:DNA modification methylase
MSIMISEAARKYIYYEEPDIVLLHGDCREVMAQLEPESIQCCVTSPPYWGLRDYGVDGQLGLERTPEEYTERMTEVFDLVSKALRPDGTLWLNLGDTYAANRGYQVPQTKDAGSKRDSNEFNNMGMNASSIGFKPKDLIGIPWRVAFALQAAGWYLRSDIIWHKPNPMPESVTDRPTKAHEYIFLMSRAERYFYNQEAVKESAKPESEARYKAEFFKGNKHESGGYSTNGAKHTKGYKEWTGKRNKRTVWTVGTKPYPGAHFAVFPPELIEPCILAGTKEGDIVLDPFSGSGTVGQVCKKHKRRYIGIEINEEYLKLSPDRIGAQGVLL